MTTTGVKHSNLEYHPAEPVGKIADAAHEVGLEVGKIMMFTATGCRDGETALVHVSHRSERYEITYRVGWHKSTIKRVESFDPQPGSAPL